MAALNIEWRELKLAEPTTTITDYVLAAETIFLGILLLRNNPSLPLKFWSFAFFVLAIAAIAGGTYHGFIQGMNAVTAQVVWKITLYSIGLATLLMLSAAILVYLPHPWKTVFLAVTSLQFAMYVFVMWGSDDFKYVVYNYVPAMIAILLMSIFHGNMWLVAAVLISFAGAAIQRSGFVLHKHLNFNDLYHIVQMVGMYCFYRGAKISAEC